VTLLYAALALAIWSRGAGAEVGRGAPGWDKAVLKEGEVMKSKLGMDAGIELRNGLP
jgi:hypothetical protein